LKEAKKLLQLMNVEMHVTLSDWACLPGYSHMWLLLQLIKAKPNFFAPEIE